MVVVIVARTVGNSSSEAPLDAGLRGELEQLRVELDVERRARRALAQEVAALRVDLLRATTPRLTTPEPPEADPEPIPSAADTGETPKARFDGDVLRDAGIPNGEILDLHEAWERYELAKLDLHDRALRAGWSGNPRHNRQLRALDRRMRDELGDEGYDAFLYATGRENRIVVDKLLSAAKGALSGLQPGDVVWSYDGARIFHAYELAGLSISGPRGEYVRMQVLRNGERISLGTERGPMPVHFREASRPPARP